MKRGIAPVNKNFKALNSKKIKSSFPEDIKPMLATLVDRVFEDKDWLYELKWDGYRCIGYNHPAKKQTSLRSRNNKSFNEKFYPVFNALKATKLAVVFDGEIVVLNEKGLPDFADLQNWRSEADGILVYYVFDILWYDGYSLLEKPLIERREILRKVIAENEVIKLSENFDSSGTALFDLADKLGLEGIMAKRKNSIYIPDLRTKDWLKIKTEKHQELIIGGYTKNEGSPKPFSALLLGRYFHGRFEHVTPVGTGFTINMQKDILNKLKRHETNECPFASVPDYNKPSRFRPNPPKAEVTWVKPIIVCEISYREMTKDGSIRHPSFRGLREDKNAEDVVWEIPNHLKAEIETNETIHKQLLPKQRKQDRRSLLNPTEETQVKKVGGHELKFTNLSKIYWPKEQVTKRDMLNYYYRVAPFILPYVKDRPQTLNRYPNGINGKTFYQKDVKGKVPSWLKTFPYYSHADGREKEFSIISDEASLLFVASLGCIEINPWSSKIQTPDNPDWCIIDLDPDKNSFEQVIEAACVTREILDAIDVPSFCKTSGSTGLHIYIPMGAKYTYEQSKEFARVIAKLVHGQIPGFTSIERKISDRDGKMYIDFLQNRPQATVAAPYSLRPKDGATVSMPLHWDEVKKGLSMKDFTIFNAVDRLKETGDLFKGVLGKGIDLIKVTKKMESMFGG